MGEPVSEFHLYDATTRDWRLRRFHAPTTTNNELIVAIARPDGKTKAIEGTDGEIRGIRQDGNEMCGIRRVYTYIRHARTAGQQTRLLPNKGRRRHHRSSRRNEIQMPDFQNRTEALVCV